MTKAAVTDERELRRAERLVFHWDRLFGRIKRGMGRRNRTLGRRRAANFQARYEHLTGTNRHCYNHPQNPAVAIEVNAYDKSYRVPVCYGCAGVDLTGGGR